MTAIIKNNFRLQNARDFLENFVSHPRTTPLTQNSSVGEKPEKNLVINTEGNFSTETPGVATLTFKWDFNRLSSSTNSLIIRQEAIEALESQFGAHVEDRNHYLFVGKPTPWGTGSQVDELYPKDPNDTLEEEARVWDEMLGLKKIEEIFASLVVPRRDWDTSKRTVYAVYDDRDPNLYNQPTKARSDFEGSKSQFAGSFYVMTDAFDVFICLENGGGVPSTQKPVRPNTPTDLVALSDGYVWKYITTIKQSDVVRFLTDSWMPIKTLKTDDMSFQWDVQQNAVGGTVLSFHVPSSQQGSGYVYTHTGRITFPSAGPTVVDNGVVKATAKLNALDGSSPNPTGVDDAYVSWDLHVTSGDDQGAIYNIQSYNKDTKVVVLNRDWNRSEDGTPKVVENTTYDILPKLVITTNGDANYPVTGKPVVKNGSVVAVNVVESGKNATWATASILAYSGSTAPAVRPILSSTKGLGKDPEKDLGAYFVMLSSKLSYKMGETDTTLDFPINNDYRQIGIIRNVKNADGSLATEKTRIATKRMLVYNVTQPGSETPTFHEDEQIEATINSKTVKAQIIDSVVLENNRASITFIQNPSTGYGSFEGANVKIKGVTSDTEADIVEIFDEEIKRFEGEILYLENRRPVLREKDMVEDIKTIIEF